MRMIVTAGGTGGHIYPALAVIEYFKRKEQNLEVLYIGTHDRMEKDIVPDNGIEYIPLEMYGLSKTKMFRNIKTVFLIGKNINKCKNIIKKFKPDIVLGFGGYVTYPVIKAAKKLSVPVFLHEQNSMPGKANVALSKDINLIGVTFNETLKHFDKANKVFYSGHPCGERALHVKPANKEELGLDKSKKTVLFSSGSLGSTSVNDAVKEYLLGLRNKNYQVIYMTGKDHYEEFIKDTTFPDNVKVLAYYDPLTALMGISDVLVTRAGAGTISEFLTLKIPSIVIPSPFVANNHQYYNAKEIADDGACILLEEKKLNSKTIAEYVEMLLNNKEKVFEMKKSMDKFAASESCELIYQEIKEVLKHV